MHLQPSELSSGKFLKGRGINTPEDIGWLLALFPETMMPRSPESTNQALQVSALIAISSSHARVSQLLHLSKTSPSGCYGFKPSEWGQHTFPAAKENRSCRNPWTLEDGTTHLAESWFIFKLVPKETKFPQSFSLSLRLSVLPKQVFHKLEFQAHFMQ